MTINDTPTTESQLTVLAKYPEAKEQIWRDKDGPYYVILTGSCVRGFGETSEKAWKYAADIIHRHE